MKSMLKFFSPLLLLLLASTAPLKAQFTKAEIEIAGLTCPSCSRSVEMALRELDFVADVEMNLEKAAATVLFNSKEVNMQQVARQVEGAGFSVILAKVFYTFPATGITEGSCLCLGSSAYRFVEVEKTPLQGSTGLLFIDKRFVPAKDFSRKWKARINALPASAEECCRKADKAVYHVTF
jgi:copper chaperone CopZ